MANLGNLLITYEAKPWLTYREAKRVLTIHLVLGAKLRIPSSIMDISLLEAEINRSKIKEAMKIVNEIMPNENSYSPFEASILFNRKKVAGMKRVEDCYLYDTPQRHLYSGGLPFIP